MDLYRLSSTDPLLPHDPQLHGYACDYLGGDGGTFLSRRKTLNDTATWEWSRCFATGKRDITSPQFAWVSRRCRRGEKIGGKGRPISVWRVKCSRAMRSPGFSVPSAFTIWSASSKVAGCRQGKPLWGDMWVKPSSRCVGASSCQRVKRARRHRLSSGSSRQPLLHAFSPQGRSVFTRRTARRCKANA